MIIGTGRLEAGGCSRVNLAVHTGTSAFGLRLEDKNVFPQRQKRHWKQRLNSHLDLTTNSSHGREKASRLAGCSVACILSSSNVIVL
jgi:hypothetical protein